LKEVQGVTFVDAEEGSSLRHKLAENTFETDRHEIDANSPASIIGSAPDHEYVQLSSMSWGYPGVSTPREAGSLASANSTANASANASANSTANATENATAEADANETANATAAANSTDNATGNATAAFPGKYEYNSPAYVMPYAKANDPPAERKVNFDLKQSDRETPYHARPAKYASNYPMNNDHRRYAPPAPKDD